MKNKKLAGCIIMLACILTDGCRFPVGESIDYCASQASRTIEAIGSPNEIPNAIPSGSSTWVMTSPGYWTCGFWAGDLWHLYEGTGDSRWKEEAAKATDILMPLAFRKADSHDVGFMTMTSIGNGYRLTGEKRYKDALVSAADSLARLYNPKVGTILSWPGMVKTMGWPHNTIIDNMLNLELLFWVADNAGRPDLYEIAYRHAEVTMKHQFRDDGSTYHVMVFDADDGHFIEGHTHQGWKDESTWSRGQAWAIYGFTVAYRYTHDVRFMETAVKAADYFISRLPSDLIPYWDFDAGNELSDQPRDCSAAAITASALLELQTFLPAKEARRYKNTAVSMIRAMSSEPYRAGSTCPAFLLHSTGHMPNGNDVDASISYADYYYLESLIRLKRLEN